MLFAISGFTPAYAGKIEAAGTQVIGEQVHPRIRGEDTGMTIRFAPLMGSPPHTRGRLGNTPVIDAAVRFTPAYAGKIMAKSNRCRNVRVHPRIRGEDRFVIRRVVPVQGSPPHTRGRSWAAVLSVCMLRFTPAYAGKIGHARRMPLEHRVHPRIRGEDIFEHGAAESK